MKRQTLPWMLSMFLVASAGSFGCDDGDTPATKPDGGGTGGAGGAKVDAAAGGGAGGVAAGGAGGAQGGAGGVAQGGAGGGVAGAGGGGGSPVGGSDAGPDTAAGGAGGALPTDGGPDAVVDMAPRPDAVADMAAVDMAAGSMTNVTQCSQIACADYFTITNACAGFEDMAWVKQDVAGGTNVCASPSGTKRRITVVDDLDDHVVTIKVSKPDNTPCYTVELATNLVKSPTEFWTYKKPDGTVFALGGYTDNATTGYKRYLTCGGVRYNVMDGRSCAGFEGDTGDSASATTGTCTIP